MMKDDTKMEKLQWDLLGVGILFGIFLSAVVIVRYILENI